MGRLIRGLPLVVAALLASSAAAQAPDRRPLVAFVGPLSGEYESVGVRAWQAISMAATQTGDMRLLRFDSADLGAAPAYAAAVESGAHAIIGPIGEAESRVVAELAADDGTPVFLLNGIHRIEVGGARVFRMRTSPHDQTEALVGALLAQEQELSFAVFAPDDTYGAEASEAFVRAASRYGGHVLRAIRYEAGEPDVGDAIGLLVGERSLRLRDPVDPWNRPPDVRVSRGSGDRARPDALFIPDYADQVASILPHLDFHGWVEVVGDESVRLLGLSGWVSTALQPAADLAASAIVTQVFDPDAVDSAAEAFTLEWGVRFDEAPTAFEAQTYDAAMFVFETLRASPTLEPAAVATTALELPDFGGVCGDMWLNEDGGVVRQIGLWQVDGAGLVFPIGVVEPPRDRVPR